MQNKNDDKIVTGFISPSLDCLVDDTNKLYKGFSQQLMLYSIDKPADTGQEFFPKIQQTTLQWWFARVQGVIDCETRRTTAHDVFKDLVLELKNVNIEDLVQSRKATSFLIGALLHRYFRIIQEYDDYNNSKLGYVYQWYVGSARLFMAIRTALKFPVLTDKESKSFTTTQFKEKDLGSRLNLTGMDYVSIVVHLETFRDNMLLKDKAGEPRYKKYEHLNNDVNFEKHLNEIIACYKVLANTDLQQLRAIFFIESLTVDVVSRTTKLIKTLEDWHKLLVKDHPDFSTLDISTIRAHVSTKLGDAENTELKDTILNLLNAPRIKSTLEQFQYKSDTFLVAMKKAATDSAAYTIVGGYSLLLQSTGIDNLKFSLRKVLGIEKTPEFLATEASMLIYIKFLAQYITLNPTIELNYGFFESQQAFGVILGKIITCEESPKESQSAVPRFSFV